MWTLINAIAILMYIWLFMIGVKVVIEMIWIIISRR